MEDTSRRQVRASSACLPSSSSSTADLTSSSFPTSTSAPLVVACAGSTPQRRRGPRATEVVVAGRVVVVVAGRRAPRRTPAPPISPLGRLAGVPALLVVGRASVGVVGVVLLLVVVAPAVAARTLPNRSSPGGGLLAAGPVPRLDHPVPHLLPGPHAAPATVRPRRLEGRALGRRELQRPLTRGEAPRAREGGEPVPPYRASPSSLHLPRCPASRQPPRRRRSSASTLWRSMCQRVPPS